MAKKNFKRQSSFQSQNEIEDEHYISKSQAKLTIDNVNNEVQTISRIIFFIQISCVKYMIISRII